ncbi:MAG: outer membrane protein transport protein [Melioribacteraceae bacterium]|nr:outer membrane protein transport protein [Melioribacteraceae bacterium]
MKKVVMLFMFTVMSVSLFAQNGARLIDYNAKSIGRGGTSIGIFDSPNLMLTNPGGISFLEKSQLDVNFSAMIPSLHFKNDLNDKDGEDSFFPLPSIAYVNKCKENAVTWGFGVFTIGGMGAEFDLKHQLYGDDLQNYYSNLGIIQFGPSIAYKFNENLSVGISAHLVYAMMDFRMPFAMAPEMLGGQIPGMGGMSFGGLFAAPPQMGGFGYDELTAYSRMDDLSALGFNGKIGVAYKVNEKLSLGLKYSLPTKLNFKDGTASMDMSAQFNEAVGLAIQGTMAQGYTMEQAQGAVMQQFGGMGIDVNDAMINGVVSEYDLEAELTMPQSLGFGISYAPVPCLRLALDAEWLNWSDAFDTMTLTMTDGTNNNVNTMLGSESITIPFQMNWEDTYIVKLGVEYDVNKQITLRGGTALGSNPVPDATVFPVFPAIVENHIMFGASYKVSEPITVHASFQKALDNDQTGSSDNVVSREFRNATNTLGNSFFNLALSWTL